MKKTRILQYTWEELSGLEELDGIFEEVRLWLRLLISTKDHSRCLRAFFQVHGETFMDYPASDLAVIFYRLLEFQTIETLKGVTAIELQIGSLSCLQFAEMVEACFFTKPIPVVLGILPRINL
jgi:hypothetical protein